MWKMKIELDVDLENYYTMVVTDEDDIYCVSGDDIILVEFRMELLLLELGVNLDTNILELN